MADIKTSATKRRTVSAARLSKATKEELERQGVTDTEFSGYTVEEFLERLKDQIVKEAGG